MITFWVHSAGSFGMEIWLATRAPEMADRITIRPYEGLTDDIVADRGAHIFAALDQLSPGGRATVAQLRDRLAEASAGDPLLNDPRWTLRRYDLLAAAAEAGINDFQARRATEPHDMLRLPLFVREESGHNGPLTGLLESREALAAALRALRARGFRLADLLVVEFRDLADDTGTYHSASAFKIGDHIIPVHFLTSKHWVLKWDDSLHDETAMAAHLAYVRDNPHEAWLRRVFELAQVGYGRIDYGICGDTLRLWEINLNPTFSRGPGPEPPPFAPAVEAILEESRVIFHGGLKAALRSLDPGVERSQVAVRLDPALVARLRADSARGRRRQSVLQLLHRLYRHPRLGWLFRMAYHRLVPRQ